MGLDAVELIMAVEQEFMIEIPDHTAELIVSLGQLRNTVTGELQRLHREESAELVFSRIAGIAAGFCNLDASKMEPETTLLDDLGLE